jgi:16S rRNA (guanine527-N7)-methyltransferase
MSGVPSALESLITSRIAAASAPTPPDGVGRLALYVELLAHWNRRINLTSLDVDPPTPLAIDRLIVEPLLASPWIRSTDRRGVDLGSGGGSPAIPIALACPALEMTMVESRGKKCAFLREAVRALAIDGRVEQARFQEFAAQPERAGAASVVTVRAVRFDLEFWQITNIITSAGSRLVSLSSPEAFVAPSVWFASGNGADSLRIFDREG